MTETHEVAPERAPLSAQDHLVVVEALRSGEFYRLRRDAGLTQEQVAAQLGVHISAITRWEKGRITPGTHNSAGIYALLSQLRRVKDSRGAGPEPAGTAPPPLPAPAHVR